MQEKILAAKLIFIEHEELFSKTISLEEDWQILADMRIALKSIDPSFEEMRPIDLMRLELQELDC